MKRKVIVSESQLVYLIKKVLSEQPRPTTVSIPAAAYKKMIDGAKGWGTDPKEIVDGINMLNSLDEFYQMNDMFKDKKTGYKSFDEMIRNEFEYQKGDENTKMADSNREDIEKIAKKLKSIGVPYNYGSKKDLKDFTVLPKPAPVKTVSDWEKVKAYLLANGFPPDFPDKGDEGVDYVTVSNDKYIIEFWSHNNSVTVSRNLDSSDSHWLRTWSWDGTKPVIEGGYLPNSVTKNISGYAKTEDDILTKNKILGLGSQGDLVKKVQSGLYNRDNTKNPGNCKSEYEWSSCDGVYGKLTKQSIKDYQTRNGLRGKDGNVGKETWDYLKAYTEL